MASHDGDVATSPVEVVDIERGADDCDEFQSLHDSNSVQGEVPASFAMEPASFALEPAKKEVTRRAKKLSKPKGCYLMDVVLAGLVVCALSTVAIFTYYWYTDTVPFSKPSDNELTKIRLVQISHIQSEMPSVRFSRYSPQVQLLIRDLMNSSSTESDEDVASSWDQWMDHREPPLTWVSRDASQARSPFAGAPTMPTMIRVRMTPLIPNIVARLQVLDQQDDKFLSLRNILASSDSSSPFDLRQFSSTDSSARAAVSSEADGMSARSFAPSSGDDVVPQVVVPGIESASAADFPSFDSLISPHLDLEPAATTETADSSFTDAVMDCIQSLWGSSESVETETE